MAGRYGHETVSVINLEIVDIKPEQNLMFVKGAVPGVNKGLVRIKTTTRAVKKVAKPFAVFTRAKPSGSIKSK